MIIRNLEHRDHDRIEEILSQHNFNYPDGPHISSAVVESSSGIVAFGAVRLITEAVLIMDKNAKLREKDVVLQLLHGKAIQDTVKSGFKELHVFVQDDNFKSVLKKHYGYRDCKGQALVMVFD